MSNNLFKTQEEYVRYLRRKRQVSQIITFFSVALLFLYIVMVNPNSFVAWLVFAAYALLVVILNYHAKQEYLKKDTETAKKEAQKKLAKQNSKGISKKK